MICAEMICTNKTILCGGLEYPLILVSSGVSRTTSLYILRGTYSHFKVKKPELKARVQNSAESSLSGGLAKDENIGLKAWCSF